MQSAEEFARDHLYNVTFDRLSGDTRARDAEIRRECAEKAQDEWEQLFCDDMIGDREFVTKKLRAAIIGEEE